MASTLPPVSLIHIGLPKTATTYLQTLWADDPKVCLLVNELAALVAIARAKGKERTMPTRIFSAPPVSLDTPPQAGQKVLISHEALSNAYLNERADAQQIRSFREYAAAQMRSLVPKSKVLMVVREPSEWILSIYNQAVKQGATDSFRQFLHREHAYLVQSLDIREIYLCWKQQYGSDNVLILPLELLREKPGAFFSEIQRFSGIAPPLDLDLHDTINPPLKEGRLDIMRAFNRWIDRLTRHGHHQGRLPPELAQALETVHFEARRALEKPAPAMERHLHVLEKQLSIQHLQRDMIPNELLKGIRSRNAKQFKKDPFFGYRDLYV